MCGVVGEGTTCTEETLGMPALSLSQYGAGIVTEPGRPETSVHWCSEGCVTQALARRLRQESTEDSALSLCHSGTPPWRQQIDG